MKDRALALAVLLAALAMAAVVPPALAVAALVLPVIAVVVGPRLELDRLAQAAATAVAMVAGVVAPRLLVRGPLDSDLTQISEQTMLLGMPVLGIAAVRALMVAPRFGAPVTLAAALVAVTAAGRARPGLEYPLFSAAFLALGFYALGRATPGRLPPRRATFRHIAATALAALAALGLTVAATITLPPLQDAAMARLLARFHWSRSGFSDHVVLGALSGLLEDGHVVMRLRGEHPPTLLRGAALSGYAFGTWDAPKHLPVPEIVEVATTAPPGGDLLELENAGRPERYFLPLDARDVTASSGFFSRDAALVYRPVPGFDAKRVWFHQGEARIPWPPTPQDRTIPANVARELRPLLAGWGALTGAPRTRLERIERHLRADYRYSLDFDRAPRRDPIVDFLLRDRRGHCEYFAGSLAVLGRLAEVPTRVVTGYRVVERSPWGYAVVRQRHAHAWVEAWLDGRWVTFDPTPPDALEAATPKETPLMAAFFDRLATGWESLDDWLARRSPFELSLALVVAVGGWLLYRNLRGRRHAATRAAPVEAALPGFLALARALARRGLARGEAETLERFVTRLSTTESLPEGERAELAGELRAYAELRYAGRGDAPAIDAELGRWARRG